MHRHTCCVWWQGARGRRAPERALACARRRNTRMVGSVSWSSMDATASSPPTWPLSRQRVYSSTYRLRSSAACARRRPLLPGGRGAGGALGVPRTARGARALPLVRPLRCASARLRRAPQQRGTGARRSHARPGAWRPSPPPPMRAQTGFVKGLPSAPSPAAAS